MNKVQEPERSDNISDGAIDSSASYDIEGSQQIVSDDGVKLFVRRWVPCGKTKAVLNIVHGMAEHSARYSGIARELCAEGIEVWAADMRGHGKTANLAINDAGEGGLLGHCSDKNTVFLVTSDIDLINNTIVKACPRVPLFLLGHSWGSFLVQHYIETYDTSLLSGCILSGTAGPDGFKIAISKPVMELLAWVKGCRNHSVLAQMLVDGPFNKPFQPNRTAFDWLSRDEKAVDTYINDPLSGKLCSSGFYRDLAVLLNQIHKKEAMSKIRTNLPIYVFSGSADPVGGMGSGPTALVNVYRSLCISDLEFVLYPGARHETLNETNREEVTDNLKSWIIQHCEKKS
jgi:alpha-beta hydrolase superfamily lysophospholipase